MYFKTLLKPCMNWDYKTSDLERKKHGREVRDSGKGGHCCPLLHWNTNTSLARINISTYIHTHSSAVCLRRVLGLLVKPMNKTHGSLGFQPY